VRVLVKKRQDGKNETSIDGAVILMPDDTVKTISRRMALVKRYQDIAMDGILAASFCLFDEKMQRPSRYSYTNAKAICDMLLTLECCCLALLENIEKKYRGRGRQAIETLLQKVRKHYGTSIPELMEITRLITKDQRRILFHRPVNNVHPLNVLEVFDGFECRQFALLLMDLVKRIHDATDVALQQGKAVGTSCNA
jgi:hypothetical protein